MMFILIGNVSFHNFNFRLANRECAKTTLPIEIPI